MIPDTSDNSELRPSYTEMPSIISNSAIKRAAGRPVVSPHFITPTSTHWLLHYLVLILSQCYGPGQAERKFHIRMETMIARWRPYGHQVQAPVSRRVAASCLPQSRDSSHTNSYKKSIDSGRTKQPKKRNSALAMFY